MNKTFRDLRLEKGLTQNEIAKILGVSTTTFSLLERGKIKPSARTIKKLMQKMTIEYKEIKTMYNNTILMK